MVFYFRCCVEFHSVNDDESCPRCGGEPTLYGLGDPPNEVQGDTFVDAGERYAN